MKAALFDLDGTLLDTVLDICACLNETLAYFGFPAVTSEQTRRFVGNGARRLLERALPEGVDVGAALADFKERYTACDNARTCAYAGAKECLSRLKESGIRLAVITNKPQRAAEHVLERFFPGMFDFIGGDSGDFPVKPDPALSRYCALSLRVAPRDCVFVGDGETDVLTAKNAGMRSVSVLWGYRPREALEEAGASEFAVDFAELEKLLFRKKFGEKLL